MAAKKKGTSSMPKWKAAPQALVRVFEAAIALIPDAQSKKMFGYPAAFVGGHLFAGLHQDSLIVRLSPKDKSALLEQPGSRIFEPMPGRPMRDYVVVPPSVVESEEQLHGWLMKALHFTSSLPPKPPKSSPKKKTR
jgi:TfoX/Sxy family transcriptional regulator of competence genes